MKRPLLFFAAPEIDSGRVIYTMLLFEDVFSTCVAHKIFARLNAGHAAALAATNRNFAARYAEFLGDKTPRAGTTLLYPRQSKAIAWLHKMVPAQKLDKPRVVVLNAYPSFGKTLTILEWAIQLTGRTMNPLLRKTPWRNRGDRDIEVTIFANSNILKVWGDEIYRHYSVRPSSIGRFTTADPQTGQIFLSDGWTFSRRTYDNMLIRMQNSHFDRVVVIDESHRDADGVRRCMERSTHPNDIPLFVMLTANQLDLRELQQYSPFPIFDVFKASSSKMLTDNIEFETVLGNSVSGAAAEIAMRRPDQFTLLLYCGISDVHLRKKLDDRPNVTFCKTYNDHVPETKGLVVAPLRSFAEGFNFNSTNHLIIAATSASRSDIFQGISRVCRDSNRNNKITITFVLPTGKERPVHIAVAEAIETRGVEGKRYEGVSLGLSVSLTDEIMTHFGLSWKHFRRAHFDFIKRTFLSGGRAEKVRQFEKEAAQNDDLIPLSALLASCDDYVGDFIAATFALM